MDDDRDGLGTLELDRRWAAVRARMEAAADILARRGSVASRLTGGGTRVSSVRYFDPGTGRQRAIYLGSDGELVRRARALLAVYREHEALLGDVEGAARFASSTAALGRRGCGPVRVVHRRPRAPPGRGGTRRAATAGGVVKATKAQALAARAWSKELMRPGEKMWTSPAHAAGSWPRSGLIVAIDRRRRSSPRQTPVRPAAP